MIQKGSTPEIIIDLDLDITEAVKVFVSFAQRDKVVIEKTKEECTITETDIRMMLTRDETLRLDEQARVEAQITAEFIDGSVIISNIMETTVGRLLKGGVI